MHGTCTKITEVTDTAVFNLPTVPSSAGEEEGLHL